MFDSGPQERRFEPRPSTGEAPFFVGEVFYSRTDTRGVIASGNYIFQRVSNYAWEDLIGAPHKKIRHPDMPKGVFFLMWEKLKRGEIVGAYVKNLAQDGLHYWVFAAVAPAEGGYISSRLKPTSNRLAIVKELYAKALQKEQGEGLSPEDSAAFICAEIEALGFTNYDDFASDSLSEEMQAERKALGIPESQAIVRSKALVEKVGRLSAEADELLFYFAALSTVPRNLQVKAKSIEASGGPLTALSNDYSLMSQEMAAWFSNKVVGKDNNFHRVAQRVKDALYCQTACELLSRCRQHLQTENRTAGSFCRDDEIARLSALIEVFTARGTAASDDVAREAQRLQDASKKLNRALMGLNTVRVTGKIENARLGPDSHDLGEIITQLGVSQGRVETALRKVQDTVEQIARSVNETSVKPAAEFAMELTVPSMVK